ncbi:MAG: PTPA-CTERM sorting domain-containing protein [Leptolyngbya sp. BL-A-14]
MPLPSVLKKQKEIFMFSSKHLASVAVGAMVAAVTFGSLAPKAQALSFGFQFDNTPNSTVTPPIAGTGTFNFDGDPGDGTFALTSLTNYQFNFNFLNGSAFNTADIKTPLANILVKITSSGGLRSLNFGGSTGGPFLGSLDFTNASGGLSFQPNFGSLYFTTRGGVGTYKATVATSNPTAVPTPALLPGLIGLGAAALRKRKTEKVKVEAKV